MFESRPTVSRLLVPLVVVCMIVALGVSSTPLASDASGQETIRAKKFIVVDDSGNDVGEFGYEKGTVRVRIPPDIDKPGVWLGAHGPAKQHGLILIDEHGHARLEVASDENGRGIMIRNEKGDPHLFVGAGKDDSASIWVGAGSGKACVSVTIDERGRPAINLADGKDHRRALIYLDSEGVPGIAFFEEDGKTVAREIRPDEK